jgi:hypothetical protein
MDDIFIPTTGFGTPRFMDSMLITNEHVPGIEIVYLAKNGYRVHFYYYKN